jgi:hypothetical protein
VEGGTHGTQGGRRSDCREGARALLLLLTHEGSDCGRKPPSIRWRVEVAGHHAGAYHVPAQTLEVSAEDEREARATATRAAHVAASVPCWRPLLRATYPFTSARLLSEAA